jgi:ABC-type transport system involved in multi-copper enzyme maturation permease subunit
MMTQTLAISRDAYRELNAKKLFWIVLALSGVVVAAFGAIGLTPRGMKVLFWEFDSYFNTSVIAPATFYKLMFVNLGIGFWLAWLATILALISTAGIIPDFISSGSIELVLSRPIGRLRLFLTKYLTGLLFTTLQVTVFTTAAFLVIGIRGSDKDHNGWEWGLFWAVPITVCFFSYLFSICVVIGMWSRSTIAALLLTLLCWLFVFGLHASESIFLGIAERSALKIEIGNKQVSDLEAKQISAHAKAQDGANPESGNPATGADSELDAKLARLQSAVADAEKGYRWQSLTQRLLFDAKTLLPKTSETIDLLKRTLVKSTDMEKFAEQHNTPPMVFPGEVIPVDPHQLQKRIEATVNSRSVPWVIGTSLCFEAAMLGLGALMFCRRDF